MLVREAQPRPQDAYLGTSRQKVGTSRGGIRERRPLVVRLVHTVKGSAGVQARKAQSLFRLPSQSFMASTYRFRSAIFGVQPGQVDLYCGRSERTTKVPKYPTT
jgi:hypothetical protein